MSPKCWIERVAAETFQQLGAGHMTGALALFGVFLAHVLHGVVQTLADEGVCLAVEPGVFLANLLNHFVKFHVLHFFWGLTVHTVASQATSQQKSL
jgi:hypothetical protein